MCRNTQYKIIETKCVEIQYNIKSYLPSFCTFLLWSKNQNDNGRDGVHILYHIFSGQFLLL